ncbi:CoA transferase subunit A [Dethiosulfovibrio salsuginis]|uniref:Butyryl-CoA:acetoacetate CoA-transferase alpha subunit n=1 Tax=Dethiosulfovibrio salsuginis TaxID=561720 RepID=A0A1X7IRY4_9BACT|nr:CoA transferase subunit A [Dethiosulfovibrio salsuginis]SMG17768.1 butyryl-CoA:acetoacetate CoA-transferase alpha subunit [Dethiosulfovibrio salsuginis]
MPITVIKPVVSATEAISYVKDGASVMVGGFNYGGVPYTLIEALCKAGTKDLHLIANDTVYADDRHPKGVGHGSLVVNGQVKKVTASHVGLNKETQRQYNQGTLELELVPQGTFVERIRAGGFGLGGFLTPTGVGTVVEEGKQIIEVEGKRYILELPLRADVALIKGHRADRYGNLTYYGTNRNFNPAMATAADLVIAEVDSVVEQGDLDPNEIVTSGIVVDILVLKGDSFYATRT